MARKRLTQPATCCAPIGVAPLTDAHELARAFTLGEPARLRILSFLASAPDGEICVGDLVEPLGRSIPDHLEILSDAGLITRDRRGRPVSRRSVPERLSLA